MKSIEIKYGKVYKIESVKSQNNCGWFEKVRGGERLLAHVIEIRLSSEMRKEIQDSRKCEQIVMLKMSEYRLE